ncbi:MAG: preprotein translocase subunit SecY, partial [Gemmatimonadota bacterium]|nr:preprotein translocase subunit SecY [Gemmatimonadota bacterium]
VLLLTAGGIYVMWLGEQITERGIGNGMSLLIFFSIIQGFPGAVINTFELWRAGGISLFMLAALGAVLTGVTAAVVALTMAARRIPVQIPRKVVGRGRVREGQKSFIPIRINSAGVMPIIFAQAIIIIPGTLYAFTGGQGAAAGGVSGFLYDLSQIFAIGSPWYYTTYALLIIVFTYVYTAIIFDPIDLAENLRKQGGFIPGVKPGASTAEYIDRVLTRVTLPGSVYLAIIALLPFFIFDAFNIQTFFFGGTSLLIVVGVALDTVQQMQQHLLLRQYEGFMKKGRVKYRGRQRYM